MKRLVRFISLALAAALCLGLLAACGGSESSSVTSSSSVVSVPPPPAPPSESFLVVSSEPVDIPEPEPPVASASSSEVPSEPPKQPAPEFVESTPAVVSVDSRRVTVSYKTNVKSTVNAVLSNVGDKISTATFYDYTRRGVKFEGAISSKTTYSVTSAGTTETFDLPDTSMPYYLILNAVEDETGTWQSTTTVILLYDPGTAAPTFSAKPIREADTDTSYVWLVETNAPIRVWALVVANGATAPTATQIRDNNYTGTAYGHFMLDTAGEKAPYTAKLNVPRSTLGAGEYSIWLVLQKAGDTAAPIAVPVEVTLSVKA